MSLSNAPPIKEPPCPRPTGSPPIASISDPQKFAAYAKLAPPAIAPFGGRYLARGTAGRRLRGGEKERIVISEFPSVGEGDRGHDSPAYQDALEALGDGAVRDIRIVEGLDCTVLCSPAISAS